MEFRILENSEIDFNKWNHCVLESPTPLVFAQTWYLQATCENWKGLIIDDYQAVMPLTYGTNQFITYLIQPPFTPQLGVYGAISKKNLEKVYSYIQSKFLYVNIECNFSNELNEINGFKSKNTYILEQSADWKLNDNTKRNWARAKKAGYRFEEIADLKTILKLCDKVMVPWLVREIGLSKLHGLYFRELIVNAYTHEQLKAFAVKTSLGEIKAFGYFISNGKHTVYLKGMGLDAADKTGSMHMLLTEVIHYYRNKCVLFDFGGGSLPGLARFYKGLGGSPLSFYTFKVNKLPWPLNKLK